MHDDTKPNVTPLRSVPGTTYPSVVSYLEETLTAARRGEIMAIATITVAPNSVVRTSGITNGHRHVLVAGTVYLQQDLAKED